MSAPSGTFLMEYKFSNPHIKTLPPYRDLSPVEYSGTSYKGGKHNLNFSCYELVKKYPPFKTIGFSDYIEGAKAGSKFILTLKKMDTQFIKDNGTDGFLSSPPKHNDWGLMNEWIMSMWEALYNPIFIINEMKGRITIYDGQHRFRLLNNMGAEHLYCYELITDMFNIGDLALPIEVENKIRQNDRPPINTTVIGHCKGCGRETRWWLEKHDRVNWVLNCSKCRYKRPYPWSGEV